MTSPAVRTWIALLLVAACRDKPAADRPASPPAIELPGEANGLYWDEAEHALYFTDDTRDRLLRWTDRDGIAEVVRLPPTPKVAYGGLVRTADGSFVIASFGFDNEGAVIVVDPAHEVHTVPNLDKARRRVGLARGPDGALYDVFFVVDDSAPSSGRDNPAGHRHHGGLAKLDLATGETDLALPGLVKPVGVAADARGVYVSDQAANAIVAWRANAVTAVASGLPGADLLALLPDGSLVTGGKAGRISRVAPDGQVTTVVQGLEQVRGLAYDVAGKRLFVVEHGKTASHHALRIVPLP